MSSTASNSVTTLVTSLAILCFQFCPIRWFLSLQSVNKHWYNIGFRLPLSRKWLTFDNSWIRNDPSMFLVEHPQFKALVQLDIKLDSMDNFPVVQCFHSLRKLTLDFTPAFNFQPHHSFPSCLEELALDICEIENVKHLTLSSSTHPNLRAVRLWIYQRQLNDSDRQIVESILFPLSNSLQLLYLESSDRLNNWQEKDILGILAPLCQLNSFRTNFIFSKSALIHLDYLLGQNFMLVLFAPRGYSKYEQDWFENIKELLHEKPVRANHWYVYFRYSRFLSTSPRNTPENCFDGFQRVVQYLPLVAVALKDEWAVMPSTRFESLEPWTKLAQCRKLREIVLVFDTRLLLTLEHIQALRPIYHQLITFRLSTLQLSFSTLVKLKEEVRINMKGLIVCEEPFQNIHLLCPFQEKELLLRKSKQIILI